LNPKKEPNLGLAIPFVPSTAPFTTEQRAWLNGYLAGLFADANVIETSGAPSRTGAARPTEPLLVLFGSQTGGAEGLARRFAGQAERHGFAPCVFALNDFEKADFTQASRAVIISSTWGDGDPPDNAVRFWQYLNSANAPKLDRLTYAVLALGDRNYSDFCGAGRKFDERLEQLGARRLVPRGDCDIDYEATAKAWIEELWAVLDQAGQASGVTRVETEPVTAEVGTAKAPHGDAHRTGATLVLSYDRTRPFPARLIANRKLNGPGSDKDTRHLEISLAESGLSYETGDALGVVPANCPVLVEELLAAIGLQGEEAVLDSAGQTITLHEALLRHYAISQPAPALLRAAAERSRNSQVLALLAPDKRGELDQWLYGRDVVDVLRACGPVRFDAREFVTLLRPLQARLYSISSSLRAHSGEAHLTVAVLRYEAHGRVKKGVCSCFLADRVVLNQTPVPVFVQTSHGFRLPQNGDTPIIMIGPGTGIAPFRAFLEERHVAGAKGRNWLLFGHQHRSCDFFYREELEAMLAVGTLTRLDAAFSRDQLEKVYVQHLMLEHARQLWDWLECGGHIYVCGDAKRMAKDVDATLLEVIQKAGGRSKDQAIEYVARLKTGKRYQRDVY
jgi:sulfite reductase (NADPH) flavoprotein alpha-component